MKTIRTTDHARKRLAWIIRRLRRLPLLLLGAAALAASAAAQAPIIKIDAQDLPQGSQDSGIPNSGTLGGAFMPVDPAPNVIYVLMGNHYHLLLETPEANLVAGMKWLQGAYTQRFNSRHKVFGHLFQGRYKSLIVDGSGDGYFQVVSTYIHLNPARARLIRIGQEQLKTYPWSSYPLYFEEANRGVPSLDQPSVTHG